MRSNDTNTNKIFYANIGISFAGSITLAKRDIIGKIFFTSFLFCNLNFKKSKDKTLTFFRDNFRFNSKKQFFTKNFGFRTSINGYLLKIVKYFFKI